MDHWIGDLRIAFRKLRRRPGFASTVVLMLALGVGAGTSLFSVLDAVLFRPLPYSQPGRLALLWEVFPESGFAQLPSGEINFPIWQEPFDSLRSIAGFKLAYRNLTEPAPAQRVASWDVSWNLFDTLGVDSRLGRTFESSDARPGAEAVVILSADFWEARFGSDPAVLNRSLWLNGRPHRIVGVLPEGIFFPPPLRILGGTHELAGEIFLPGQFEPGLPDPRRNLAMIVRLAPTAGWKEAQREVARRASHVAEVYPEYNPDDLSATLVPIHEQAVSESKGALRLATIAVALILLITCLNVANLLLARGFSQLRETMIRKALGAGPLRILRLLMTENLILAILGGIAGSLLALWNLQLLTGLIAGQIPRLGMIEFSNRVWIFSCGLTLLMALLFGLLPALHSACSGELSSCLSARRASASIRPTLRTALVISEVGLATLLLVIAGLMLQSFQNLQRVNLGFEAGGRLGFTIQPSEDRYPNPQHLQNLMRRLLQEVRASPAVTSAGAVSGLPLSGDREGVPIEVEGRPTPSLDERLESMSALRSVTPGYFPTLEIPFLAGRDIQERDSSGGNSVAVVDRSFVNRFLQGENAVGRRITFDDDQDPGAQWREIVGVVEDVKQYSLHEEAQFSGTVYVPYAQLSQPAMTLVVHSPLPAEMVTNEVLERIRGLDAGLAVDVAPVQGLIDQALARHRASTFLLSLLAATALLLSVIGLYGVISFIVTGRKREIGVRMALGASAGRIFRLVLVQTSRWTVMGILAGSFLALVLNRVLSALLFEVSALSPATYGSVAGLFLIAALLATWLPARRASRVDPSSVLRDE